jgi:hypothetical protein
MQPQAIMAAALLYCWHLQCYIVAVREQMLRWQQKGSCHLSVIQFLLAASNLCASNASY